MLLQLFLLWLGILAHVVPCDCQTDFTIKRFEFSEPNITFVTQEQTTFNIILKVVFPIEPDDMMDITTNFVSTFYLNNSLDLRVVELIERSGEEVHRPGLGELSKEFQLFGIKEDDELRITLPASANCSASVPYSFCVHVEETINKWTASGCLYNVVVSCNEVALVPFYQTTQFIAGMIGVGVIVIFIVSVCCVLYRFRKRIARSGRWQMFTKTPEEAYNVIRKRLDITSFHDKKPYVIDPDTNLPVVVTNGDDDYSHLNRFTLERDSNDGTDNPTFDKTKPELHPYEDNVNKHPYEENIGTPVHHYEDDALKKNPYERSLDLHPYEEQRLESHPYEDDFVQSNPYEDKIQGTSGGSMSSGSQIHVSVENEMNQRKDSSSEPDTKQTGSDDSYLQQSVSGGSYISALSAKERDRSKSINPLKPDVDLERLSDASRSGGSEPRKSIDYLREPPPVPSIVQSPQNEDTFDEKPDSQKVPPPLHPRPSRQPPKPKPRPPTKPKNKPEENSKKLPPVPNPKPRQSRSGDESLQIHLPEKKEKDHRSHIYHSNITGGGSTKTPKDFRRPSLFRTPSQEQIFPSPHQKQNKALPDVYMSAIEGTQKSFPKISATGTLKRSHAQFATMALENFLALVEEIENPIEDDEIPEADTSYETATQERPKCGPIRRPLSVRRNSTPLLLDSSEKRQSTMSGYSESSYATDISDIYVNKWNKEWEIGRRDLTVDRAKPLGEGQFGKVYRGVASNIAGRPGDTLVAIKELKDAAKIEDKDEFLKELAIHTLIEPHENVIELLGCCIRDEPLCIILEFMHNGSLLRYLRKQKKNEALAQYLTVRFGYQSALGMNHVANMGIVHRDLAARNILVSDQLVCKVSDFGFARDVFGVKSYNKAPDKAPIRWYAPEAILDDTFTTKTDVWSFGILLFEIITMGYVLPYHRDPSTASVRLTIATGGVPPKPPYCNDELYDVMKLCWHRDPEKRPEFVELARILGDLQDRYEPPSPFGESDA